MCLYVCNRQVQVRAQLFRSIHFVLTYFILDQKPINANDNRLHLDYFKALRTDVRLMPNLFAISDHILPVFSPKLIRHTAVVLD